MRWRCALALTAVAATAGCSDEHAVQYRVYQVQDGDTLGHVAERFSVGSGEIVRLNDLDNPNMIRAGGGLKLPDKAATEDLPLYRPHRYQTEPPPECELKRIGGPTLYERVERWGCWTTDCLPVGPDRRVCKCASDEGGRLVVERDNGTVLLGWPGAGFMGETLRFGVLIGDLDRDGSDELIVASHNTTSNGMAVETWNMAILDGGDVSAPPVTFTVRGYGAHTFRADPATGACDVHATEWLDAPDQLLGTGYYFVSRAYRFGDGALVPRNAPVVAERNMADSRPELRDTDPFIDEEVQTVKWGTVRRVHRRRGEHHSFEMHLEIELADGTTATYRPGNSYSVESAHTFARLGDSATRRIYPKAYVPSNAEALVGSRVRIEGFEDPGSDLQWHVIWFA